MNWPAISTAIVGFGFWGLFLSLAVRHLNPVSTQLAYSSSNLVFTLLLTLAMVNRFGKTVAFTTQGVAWTAAASLMGVVAGLSTLAALDNSKSPGVVNAIIHTCPVVTLLLTVLFLGETVSLQTGVGLILVTLGLILVSL